MQQLELYLQSQKIDYKVLFESVVEIDGHTYELVKPTDGKLFDENFHLLADSTESDHYIFSFGGQWYSTPRGIEKKPKLNRVRFLGKTTDGLQTSSFLGVRGVYEVLNGSGQYSEWVQKAKFLGVEVLGICERNSLAGVLKFQIECLQNSIRPIIGATYTVYRKNEDYRYDIKCYVKNEKGWINLLLINKEVNVVNNKFIEEEKLFELTNGLSIVLDPKSISYDKLFPIDLRDVELFYQLDTVVYDQEDRDKEYLLNLKKFVCSGLQPISITDAFYLNVEDAFIKTKLNQISNIFEHKSSNQYFKSKEEYFEELDNVFKNEDRSFLFFQRSISNELKLVNECRFQIPQKGKYLPVYKMTEEESKKFETNQDLFWDLIMKGLDKKVPKHKHIGYLERINTEVEVIELGHLVDYFLILWDIVKWSNEHGILTGVGRGSAGGSLVSYTLNLTHIDPIEFGLLFERFLNKGRVEGGSMPDVDLDFSGERRDEVKRYMEERYGIHQVFSVGTYNTLKLKSAIKDLAKLYNLEIQATNYITSIIGEDFEDISSGTDIVSIFQTACKTKQIMSFIQDNSELVNDLVSVLNLPKTQSIHACATIILPDERDVFHWVPVKNMLTKSGETCLVSEWEGGELESIGLLKEDILGIQQLDKFQFILNLIKKNQGIDIDIYNLDYTDEVVYKYFRKGWNQDVFHFGAKGLTQYCKLSKPETLGDLIAVISLFRPGPIESNLHNEYVLRKEGQKETEYLWGTEEITKDTCGILVYQEQIMKVCVDVGGFSLVEADDIRKALGKMKTKYSDPYKVKFIEGAVSRGCPQSEAENIWTVMERFAKYGFNACISGSERFYRTSQTKSGKSTYCPTIEEMYRIKNDYLYAKSVGKIPLYNRYRDSYGNSFSLNESGKLIKNQIVDIRFVGVRSVYKLTLVNGVSIKVTQNHKFPTDNGEKKLENLVIGIDKIYYNLGHKSELTGFNFTDKGISCTKYHPTAKVEKFVLNSQGGHEGFVKKGDTNFKTLYDYELNYKKDYCESETCTGISKRLEVHHKDQDNSNSNHSNLITLCASCHKKEHYRLGRTKMGMKGLETELVDIRDIIYDGEENVYDVEMLDPYHTFTTRDGIVTSNSHGAAYTITGYICQWLKVHYPLEFWTSAFEYIDESKREERTSQFISEISKTGKIKIVPADINYSEIDVRSDHDSNSIYWSLSSVKQVGGVAIEQIMGEREKNGKYFSFDEFLDRHTFTGSKINKSHIENLVYAGAFDKIENINSSLERIKLITHYRTKRKIVVDKLKDNFVMAGDTIYEDYWWDLQQKRLSGIAFFDYRSMVEKYIKGDSQYIDQDQFQSSNFTNRYLSTGGYIVECIERTSSKKGKYCSLLVESNYEFLFVSIFPDHYQQLLEKGMDFVNSKGKILLLSGLIKTDDFKKQQVMKVWDNSEIVILD